MTFPWLSYLKMVTVFGSMQQFHFITKVVHFGGDPWTASLGLVHRCLCHCIIYYDIFSSLFHSLCFHLIIHTVILCDTLSGSITFPQSSVFLYARKEKKSV